MSGKKILIMKSNKIVPIETIQESIQVHKDTLNDILDRYCDNLKYPLKFGCDIKDLDIGEMKNECNSLFNTISRSIKKLLIVKMIFIEKWVKIKEMLLNKINERIKCELSLNNDDIMSKIYKISNEERINEENHIKIGNSLGLYNDISIII